MNVYYSPEKFGLQIVGQVEFSSGAYEFDTSVLWRDVGSGVFYVAHDSGCSCPCPFEDVGINDLTKVERLQDLLDYFEARKKDSYRYDSADPGSVSEIDGAIGELLTKYRELAAA